MNNNQQPQTIIPTSSNKTTKPPLQSEPETPASSYSSQSSLPASQLLEDAETALSLLARKEVYFIKEAEELFKKQVDYIKMIDDLKKFIPNMEKIDADIKKLSALIDSPASSVGEVCAKVKAIDLAKERLRDCLAKLGDVLDLFPCRDGALESLKLANYEEAAINIKRYLSIDQAALKNTIQIICDQNIFATTTTSTVKNDQADANINVTNINKIDLNSMTTALEQLEEAKMNLAWICSINMSVAIKEENNKEIMRYLKIFPLLNEHNEGLNKYSEYLSTKIVNPLEDESVKAKKLNQADKLALLFESVAKIIEASQPLIETYYGPGHLLPVVKIVQKECDRLSRKILEEFRNETKLQYIAKVVRSSILQATTQFNQTNSASSSQLFNFQIPAVNLNLSKLDPRDVDKILNEISMIISRTDIYLDFVVHKINDDMITSIETEQQRKSLEIEVYNLVCIECELNHLIQEVCGIHVMLEEFYLNECSKKAIIMDQIDVESSSCFVSSMLDDIFFIIKKCTNRAISTKSIEVFCAVINHCVTLLESTFCRFLEDRLLNQQYFSTNAFTTKNLDLSQAYSAIQSGRYTLQSTSESELAKAQYFAALNNLSKACDYIQILREILDTNINKLKPSLTVHQQKRDHQLEKPKTCLSELSQLNNKFLSVANTSLHQLFNASFKNRFRAELRTILTENPGLSKNPEAINGLAKTLLVRLDRSLQNYLTEENYTKLVSIAGEFLRSSLYRK